MRLAIFGENRLGVVGADGTTLVDVTAALPGHDADPLTAGWWRGLCRDFAAVKPALEAAAKEGPEIPVESVRLRPAVLGPSKVIAAACNYADHVTEMHGVQERTLGKVEHWMMDFDVFLKAPSSLAGPSDDVVLPPSVVEAGHEIHHESELVVVIGTGGRDIPVESALTHVFGYTLGLDITVRSPGDRSRRKSYDTFSPIGPWVTTADEAGDPAGMTIDLVLNGDDHRQHCDTADMLMPVPDIVAYASRIMTLHPGDVIFTGAPPGVGPIQAGDLLDTRISRLGGMTVRVR